MQCERQPCQGFRLFGFAGPWQQEFLLWRWELLSNSIFLCKNNMKIPATNLPPPSTNSAVDVSENLTTVTGTGNPGTSQAANSARRAGQRTATTGSATQRALLAQYGGVDADQPGQPPHDAQATPTETHATSAAAPDNIDLHAIWYSPSALQPSSSRSPAFQRELATAYLQLVDSMHGAPSNVQAHLWTDRVSEFALHLPMVGPNGSDIEIPHSMLRTTRVTVHPQRDLPAMIDAIADPAVRDTARKLHDHPAGENIGLRADILRQIVTTFHQRQPATGRPLNAYADRDTLGHMASVRDWAAVGDNNAPPAQGLDHAKMSIRALARSLSSPQRPPCVIPDALQSGGYATRGRENDLVAAVPGAEQALSVLGEMLSTLQNVHYSGPLSDPINRREFADPDFIRSNINLFETNIRVMLADFASWKAGANSPPQPRMDPKKVLTKFLLAERVRGRQPQLQQLIHELDRQVDTTDNALIRLQLLRKITSLKFVYARYMDFIKLFVNLCSYTPQVMRATAATADAMNDFFKEVVGAMPGLFQSESSWQGSLRSSVDHIQGPGISFYTFGDADQTILETLKQQPAREV